MKHRNVTVKYARDIELAERFGVSRVTIWRWTKAGDFPSPVRLGPGSTRWRLADVEQWEVDQEASQ